MVQDGKAPFLALLFSYYTLMTFLMLCDTDIHDDDITQHSKCDEGSDLWQQQLELAFALEYDLQDTVEWGKTWLVDFNAGKTQLVSRDRSKTLVLLM